MRLRRIRHNHFIKLSSRAPDLVALYALFGDNMEVTEIIRLTNAVYPNSKEGAVHIVFNLDGSCIIKQVNFKGWHEPLFKAETVTELSKHLVAAYNNPNASEPQS